MFNVNLALVNGHCDLTEWCQFAALADGKLVRSPVYYSFHYIFIALIFIMLAALIVGLVFYLTRKKPVKTISDLRPAAPRVIDIDGIRNRYLASLKEVETEYGNKKITASIAHQKISILVRLFYAEAGDFHAEFLTLSDLKRTNKQSLTKAIDAYYPHEFDKLERGSVPDSMKEAESLIMSDEAIRRFR